MRIFISSVRRGLESERDALPGLISALGHQPVRFEDFTAQNAPSREACIRGVESSDAYLLLLGPHYGWEFDDTQQSATHDEWVTAQRLGLPRYVFQKEDVEFEPAQQAFIQQLGDYATGRFHATFRDATDLNTKVVSAIRELETAPGVLEYEPLPSPIEVPWVVDGARNQFQRSEGQLELHVLPVAAQPLSARILEQVAAELPDIARRSGVATATEALDVEQGVDHVALRTASPVRGGWGERVPTRLASLRIARGGQFTARFALASDTLGSVLDPDALVGVIATGLRLAGTVDRTQADRFAIAIGLTSSSGVMIGSESALPRNSGAIGMRSEAVRVEPDEVVSRAALDRGAAEVAAAAVRALVRAFDAAR